jgi:hypothetical protein
METIAGTTASPYAGAALAAYGTSLISTTAANVYYKLGTPVAGLLKKLICTSASTSLLANVYSGSSGVTFGGTNTMATFNTADDALILKAISATRWYIEVNNGTVTLATT